MIEEKCPPPLIDECLDQLSEGLIFTQLDLKSGYHQVNMEPTSMKYISFTSPIGKYQFKKKPFGLKKRPSSFPKHYVFGT